MLQTHQMMPLRSSQCCTGVALLTHAGGEPFCPAHTGARVVCTKVTIVSNVWFSVWNTYDEHCWELFLISCFGYKLITYTIIYGQLCYVGTRTWNLVFWYPKLSFNLIRYCDRQCSIWISGYTGGSYFLYPLAVVQTTSVCLKYRRGGELSQESSRMVPQIYGTEYEFNAGYVSSPFSTGNNGGRSLQNHDAPCVVCLVPERSTVLMMPARRSCNAGWRLEYTGYLASQHRDFHRTEYLCLDEAPEVVQGGQDNRDGALFYPVEAACGSLPCPRYINGYELACVVCTI